MKPKEKFTPFNTVFTSIRFSGHPHPENPRGKKPKPSCFTTTPRRFPQFEK